MTAKKDQMSTAEICQNFKKQAGEIDLTAYCPGNWSVDITMIARGNEVALDFAAYEIY